MSIPEYKQYKRNALAKLRKRIIKLCELCENEVASIYSSKYRINVCGECKKRL